jgi:hypothetical protein
MKHKKMPSHSSFRGSYKSHFMASIYFLGLIHQHGMGGMTFWRVLEPLMSFCTGGKATLTHHQRQKTRSSHQRLKIVTIWVGTSVWALTAMLPITHGMLKFCDVRWPAASSQILKAFGWHWKRLWAISANQGQCQSHLAKTGHAISAERGVHFQKGRWPLSVKCSKKFNSHS